jgi:hypothetical protein
MAKKIYGSLALQTQSALRFHDLDSTNYIGLLSPDVIASNFSLKLPTADASGVMKSDGSGNLSLAKVVNADVDAAAAIAYSKLNLAGSITNTDINASAAIAFSKLAALTSANILVGNGSNVATSVALSGDATLSNAGVLTIASGAVTSGKIADDTIVNADINSAAAIAYSKLNIADGDLTIAKTSGLQTNLDSRLLDTGDTITGNLTFANEMAARFSEATGNGSNYVAVKAPAALAADWTMTLPDSAGTSGYVLSTDGSGATSWVANSATVSYATDWLDTDTATKVVTHSLGSLDVTVEVYDKATGATIDVDSVVRDTTNQITLTASEAPAATDWRVVVIKA